MYSFLESNYQICSEIPMTLQVPGTKTPFKISDDALPGKSILPFPSRFRKLPASLTVEAALALPLFLFFAAALMSPMVWLDEQRKLQTRLEAACENLSTAATLLNAEEMEEGETMVCLEETYVGTIPFFQGPGRRVTLEAGARRRAWIGIRGKLGNGGGPGDGDDSEEGPMVYVGASMGRYHRYRDCHYISNDYRTLPEEAARQQKNSSGSYYKACSRCIPSGKAGGNVYITPGGEHYHGERSCSAMVSYVRKVPLREVEHLGLCSYCAGRGG